MPRIDLDSDLLRCFVAVADARGFTAAGELIGLTQSGISVRIRNLEERLGRRLFERTSRQVSLTEDGEVLLSYARRMVDLNDEAIGRLTGGETQGRLRVGLADYVTPRLVPQLLGRFNRLHPGVTMEMRTGLSMDLLPGYEAGELDVVIAGRGMVFKDGGLLYRDAWSGWRHPAFRCAWTGLSRSPPCRRIAPTAASAWRRWTTPASRGRSSTPAPRPRGCRRRCWVGSASPWCRNRR